MKETTNEIVNIIIQGLTALATKKFQRFKGEQPFSECEIQEGYFEHILIRYENHRIVYFFSPFSWTTTPDHKVKTDAIPYTKEEFLNLLLPTLKEKLQNHFFNQEFSPLYSYFVNFEMEFKCTNGILKENFYIQNEPLKVELRQRVVNYIERVIDNQERPMKVGREISIFCGKLLDFDLMQFSTTRVIEVIEQCFKVNENSPKRHKEFARSIVSHLRNWEEEKFKPLYFDIDENNRYSTDFKLKEDFSPEQVSQDLVNLYVYKNYLCIKQKNYVQSAKKELEIASKVFKSKTATQYLKEGSGTFAKEDIFYKDENVDCKANDVLSQMTIKIKNETAESYYKALDFIINLLQKGFTHSYFIKLSAPSKHFLPIKGIAKSSTHRFFANCLQYAELHKKLEEYATIAMKEFEWYEDVEAGEKSCLPSSYAVFGLGLTSENYFPLVHQYFKILDDEHQMVHKYFITNLIEQYGVTEKSLPLICDGILSAQFEMKYKALKELLNNEEQLNLLQKVVQNYTDYQKEELYYSIWGKNYKKVINF